MTLAPPKPASASYDDTRDLNYIKPRGRRLSEYEAVICYSHPDMNTGYDAGDWTFRGMDGRLTLDPTNTRLRHPDWLEYRDPSKLWQRTYIKMQTGQEQTIQAAMDGAERNGSLAEIDPTWLSLLARYYEGFAFLEWGVFRAYASVVREAYGDTLTMAYGFTAMDHIRHQQAIALYSLELDEDAGSYQEGLGRAAWLDDPVYQAARRVVERLIVCTDWAETVVVTNLLLDALLTNFVVSKFFRRLAPLHGDPVTAVISITAENDRARNLAGAIELVKMATAEQDSEGRPVPAAENRAVIQGWIDRWAPDILEAVDAFAPVYDLATVGSVKADDARTQVYAECQATLADLGLHLPLPEEKP
jgi:methane monooxygenase component A beta chain/propane monooxygenase small subunit